MAGGRGKKREKSEKGHKKSSAKTKRPTDEKADSSFSDSDEVWQCKFCKERFSDDNDKLLECERCYKKVCLQCTDGEVDEARYEQFSQEGCPFSWFCSECKPNAMQAIQKDFKIEETCKNYFEIIRKEFSEKFKLIDHRFKKLNQTIENQASAKVNEKLGTVEDEIKKINDRLDNISETKVEDKLKEMEKNMSELKENTTQNKSTSDVKTVIQDSTNEMEEREKRKTNIIFFGIPESKSTDSELRRSEDMETVNRLGKEVFEVEESVFLKSSRIGKPNDKSTRPLKVVVDSADRVNHILKSAKKLGDEEFKEFKHISIQRDMTPLELEQNKKLLKIRYQLREKTKREQTGEIWVIRGKKVINVARD